jgi:AraC family transcriptional regulator
MVCPRCIKVVKDELVALGVETEEVELGKVVLKSPADEKLLSLIQHALENNGFELLDDRKSKLIERVKIIVIDLIRDGKIADMHINLSDHLSEQLNMDYGYLSTLFSSVEGKTIERFVIGQKIEKVKELISYDEMSVKQIADFLGYSSLQALSSQFKKETGMTPSDFKHQSAKRISLDKI